ncbi:hypothetical protein [Dyadobacter arcticus]|uniref:Uncharacterized protein n=1 Tax=Dyadobacter arcticus TaxID=1078754 RepID=A0ABX0UNN3_9BACT|nr:hypothetical protein [Dyadobacter arcticus]NIJ54608.1 hypothetical protein [Dyadobacter arcticus]
MKVATRAIERLHALGGETFGVSVGNAKRLKTPLERGRDVKHVQDYPTTMSAPWEMSHRGRLSRRALRRCCWQP